LTPARGPQNITSWHRRDPVAPVAAPGIASTRAAARTDEAAQPVKGANKCGARCGAQPWS
jgi:hypothetical protein